MFKGAHLVKKPLASGKTKWYLYAYRGGGRDALVWQGIQRDKPTSFPAHVGVLIEEARARQKTHTVKTIFLAVIQEYRASQYKNLAPSTQKLWSPWIDVIARKWGRALLRTIDEPEMIGRVSKFHESMRDTPRKADTMLQVMSALCEFGITQRRLRFNPAASIKPMWRSSRADLIWTYADLCQFAQHVGRNMMCGQLYGALTGWRASDVVAAQWTDVTSLHVFRATGKSRGDRHSIIKRTPLLNHLLSRVAEMTGDTTGAIVKSSKGRGFSANSFKTNMGIARKKAGLSHLRFHDLRGTFATRLMIDEKTDSEIAEMLGWSEKQVRVIRVKYVDIQNVVRLREAAAANVNGTETVNQSVNQLLDTPKQIDYLFDLTKKKRV